MGIQYCGGLTTKFDCKYQCDPNSNGMRPCSKFYDKEIEYYDKIITNFLNLDEDDICIAAKMSTCDIDEEFLGELEIKARKLNENIIFKQRVYNFKIKNNN